VGLREDSSAKSAISNPPIADVPTVMREEESAVPGSRLRTFPKFLLRVIERGVHAAISKHRYALIALRHVLYFILC